MMSNLLRRFGLRRETSLDNQTKPTFDEDLFAFRQFGTCGFPNKPSCLSLDEDLGLLAIGTKHGFIHIFGQPGVHLQGEHESQSSVVHISFLKGKSKFITVCDDGSLVVWALKTSQLNDLKKEDVEDSETLLIRGDRKTLKMSRECHITFCCLDERIVRSEKLSEMEQGSEVKTDLHGEGKDPRLYVGTSDGNVFSLRVGEGHVDVSMIDERNVGDVTMSHDDVIIEHYSDEEVKYLGSVVSITLHPTMVHKVLVGYSIGFAVMWNVVSMRPECVFSAYQQLESLAFNHDGSEFVSSHSDGSYIIWCTIDCSEPRECASTPYGPYQCEAINKFVWKTNESSSLMIFSGGMPRSGYGNRWTVTVMRGDGDDGEQSHVVLDLTSRIIDFAVVDSVDTTCGDDEVDRDNDDSDRTNGPIGSRLPEQRRRASTPHSLVVLAEEEMIVIDLVGRDWPSYRLPHLTSPHCSAITSVFHVSEVTQSFLKKLTDAGKLQLLKNVTFTRKTWPFLGGQSMFSKDRERDLLLTGHEDGSVRFWRTRSGDIELLYRLDTAHLFGVELSNNSEVNNDSEEDWPPFKKIGAYNPFTDDPRLAIRQMILSTSQEPETLVLSGTAGQIIVCEFNSDPDRRTHRKSSCKDRRSVVEVEKAITEASVSEVQDGEVVSSLVEVHRSERASIPSPRLQSGANDKEASGSTSTHRDKDQLYPDGIVSIASSSSHIPSTSRDVAKDQATGGDDDDPQSQPEVISVATSPGLANRTKPRPSRIEIETIHSGISRGARHSAPCRESYSSSMSSSSFQFEIKVSSVNLVGDRDDFVWMGHTPLEVVNFNSKKRGSKVAPSTSPSSSFMPYPLTSSTSCSALGDFGPGFQASCVVLVHPPVSCTSLALQATWQLIGFGSEYGYGLYDYNLGRIVFSRGSKSDDKSGGGSGMFGGNSSHFSDVFRRTVRASFRRLERARSEFREKRRRSQQAIWKSFSASRGTTGHSSINPSSSLPNSSVVIEATQPPRAEGVPEKPSSSSLNNSEPHKRNAAGNNDIFKGNSLDRDPQSASLSKTGTPIVRCLYFAEDSFAPHLNSASTASAKESLCGSPEFGTFWVGTSLGTIYMYNITISSPSRRHLQPVVYSLAKEIRLKHEAPVLDICILNKSGSPLNSGHPHYPIPVVSRNTRWKFPSSIFGSLASSSTGQCLVVCSQKQVKVFSYPGLKAKRKVKVDKSTSCGGEGRPFSPSSAVPTNEQQWGDHHFLSTKNITKVAYSCFENKTDESVVESGLVCLTDDGNASVYSMPSLKLRFSTSTVSKDFMNDMKLCVLTSHGYGFYLSSPSEFSKFSVSPISPKIQSLSFLPKHPMHQTNQHKKDSEGSKKNSSEDENPKRTPNFGSDVTATGSIPVSDDPVRSCREEGGWRSRSRSPLAMQDVSGALDSDPSSMATATASTSSGGVSTGVESAEKLLPQFKKVTDISYIKDEQMIEKIISKFVQMEIPESSQACRREIQFAIPRSRGQSPAQQQRDVMEELIKPTSSESEAAVFPEETKIDRRI